LTQNWKTFLLIECRSKVLGHNFSYASIPRKYLRQHSRGKNGDKSYGRGIYKAWESWQLRPIEIEMSQHVEMSFSKLSRLSQLSRHSRLALKDVGIETLNRDYVKHQDVGALGMSRCKFLNCRDFFGSQDVIFQIVETMSRQIETSNPRNLFCSGLTVYVLTRSTTKAACFLSFLLEHVNFSVFFIKLYYSVYPPILITIQQAYIMSKCTT
jgi:hypothetical protein